MGHVWLTRVFAGLIAIAGCGFPRPTPFHDDGGVDGAASLCAASQALRCDGSDLVRCNGDGTAEIRDRCSLGCNAPKVRCLDVDPSNGLAPYLDMAAAEQDLDLGATAMISTDDGTVIVDGRTLATKNLAINQNLGPAIRVFIVHSLTSADITIAGTKAFALVSHGDIKIGGAFVASVVNEVGPGRYNDGGCQGSVGALSSPAAAGSGGGGFGTAGGKGGTASTDDGSQPGGAGGSPTGTPLLVPLRGGCDGAAAPFGGAPGGGGGAIQLVSRTEIAVTGVVAANGSSSILRGGGSGGGILLEAPIVEIAGNVVANGAGGSAGCGTQPGEAGRLDDIPAAGGSGCSSTVAGNGGDGAAGNTGARDGASINLIGTGNRTALAGHGGGGVGRIRINTAPGGLHRTTGVVSPNPSTGSLATR